MASAGRQQPPSLSLFALAAYCFCLLFVLFAPLSLSLSCLPFYFCPPLPYCSSSMVAVALPLPPLSIPPSFHFYVF